MSAKNVWKRCAVAWLAMGCCCGAVLADDSLRGRDDPAFSAAASGWLADDDGSLRTLAQLAADGNRAARLLLGRIEVTDRAPQVGLRKLSRGEWLALFRGPKRGSRFAPSWIRYEASQGNALASELQKATTLGLNGASVRSLIDVGEPEAAEHLIRKIAVDGSDADRHDLLMFLPPEHELQPYVFGFRHAPAGLNTGATAFQRMSGNAVIAFAAQRSQEILPQIANTFADLGYQAGDQLPIGWLETPDAQAIATWVLTTPAATPLARLCLGACTGNEIQACATTAFGLFGGYYEVIRLDSPVENLIPQAEFLRSDRARGMAARRIANARDEIGNRVFSETQLRGISQCLADSVQPWRIPESFD
ncbi:MAG: hypothetical protein AAF499_01065 [Pseudomonadota bacterium]